MADMMRRRQVLTGLGVSTLAIPLTSLAQSKAPRVHRIGILFGASPAVTAQAYEEFKKELRAQGFADGQNVILDPRYGEGKVEQIAHYAAELVRMKSDVRPT